MNRFIIFLCALTFLLACSGPGRDIVHIYNPTSGVLTISIDNESVTVPPDSMIRKSVYRGPHLIKYGDYLDSMDVTGNTNILINPTRAKLILNEMLYHTEYIKNGRAIAQDYATPPTSIMIDSLRYGGHFKLTDNFIVEEWFFNIGEKPDNQVDGKKYMRKGAQGGGGKNPLLISSYKLYTLKEFAANTIPLNHDKHYVEYILQQHLKSHTDQGSVYVNVDFLMASEDGGFGGSVAKIHVTNNDDIYLKESYVYDKSRHGKILETLFTITDCIVEFDSATVKRVPKIGLVKVEESLALKVLIQK